MEPMRTPQRSVLLALYSNHLGLCVVQAVTAIGDEVDEKVEEASDAMARPVRA